MNGFVCAMKQTPRVLEPHSQFCWTALGTGFCWIFIGLIFLAGCNESPSANRDGDDDTQVADTQSKWVEDRRSAREIVNGVLNEYAFAKSYSDRAVLYLSYRMDGRAIQEPQPWAMSWTENGQFAGDFFNSRIRCDGKLMDCYVFDIDTGNLDDQIVVMPASGAIPLRELYSDPIADRFINGRSELPLDERRDPSLSKLTPPQFWLLNDATQLPWLKRPDRLKRLADVEVDGKRCYVIRSIKDDETFDIWIEHDSNKVLQVAYPVTFLEKEVRSSDEIQDLCLVVRFHEAQINGHVDEAMFALQVRPNATTVKRFVKLPEPLPSELIGKPVRSARLNKSSGEVVSLSEFIPNPTALFWVAGPVTKETREQFLQVAEQLSPDQYNLSIVYSDGELADPSSGSFEPIGQIKQFAEEANVNVFYDQGLSASSQMRIKAIPAIVVLDENSRIQFARALSDKNWVPDVVAAMKRVKEGEDVATEMLAEYERYLEVYHEKLAANGASHLRQIKTPIQNASSGGVTLQRKLKFEKVWVQNELQMPGNITVVDGEQPRFFVFDGWRTIAVLDAKGDLITAHRLDFPENEGASQLRQSTDDQGVTTFVAFTPRGKRVVLFNQKFEKLSEFETANQSIQVNDCQFGLSESGLPVLLIATSGNGGLTEFDWSTQKSQVLIRKEIEALDRTSLLGTSKGELIRLEQYDVVKGLDDWKVKHVMTSGKKNTCAIASTAEGAWYALGLGFGQDQNWSLSIGSQLFESNIQTLAYVDVGEETIWAVADAEGSIHLMNGDGRWLGDFDSESELKGLNLVCARGEIQLIVSTVDGIECWKLNRGNSPGK